jgi:hypothetical protein
LTVAAGNAKPIADCGDDLRVQGDRLTARLIQCFAAEPVFERYYDRCKHQRTPLLTFNLFRFGRFQNLADGQRYPEQRCDKGHGRNTLNPILTLLMGRGSVSKIKGGLNCKVV